MPEAAKRSVRESWREAVARQVGVDGQPLAEFDARVAAGAAEAEAAFRVLEGRGLLWRVDEPGAEAAPVGETGAASE